jgi:hypothetical protein
VVDKEGLAVRKKYQLVGVLVIVIVAVGIGLYVRHSTADLPEVDLPEDDTGITNNPDEMILFSIDGKKWGEKQDSVSGQETLYECPVLGHVVITESSLKRKVLAAIKQDMRDGSHTFKCFWPHHVLRVKKNGNTVDVIICFYCHNYNLYRDGERSFKYDRPIDEKSKSLLDNILTGAGVPIASFPR